MTTVMPKFLRYSASGLGSATLPMQPSKKLRHGIRRWIDVMKSNDGSPPVTGPAGLAVKTFILLRSQCSEWVPSLAQMRCEDLFRTGDPGWNASFAASILRDAAALVPEIGECAAAVVHKDAALIDADMGISWCYDRLGTEPGRRMQSTRDKQVALTIKAKLAALLGRIARTEARSPRGEAIKVRHSGREV